MRLLDWSPVEVRALAAHMETLRASPRASAFRRVDGSRRGEEEQSRRREFEPRGQGGRRRQDRAEQSGHRPGRSLTQTLRREAGCRLPASCRLRPRSPPGPGPGPRRHSHHSHCAIVRAPLATLTLLKQLSLCQAGSDRVTDRLSDRVTDRLSDSR